MINFPGLADPCCKGYCWVLSPRSEKVEPDNCRAVQMRKDIPAEISGPTFCSKQSRPLPKTMLHKFGHPLPVHNYSPWKMLFLCLVGISVAADCGCGFSPSHSASLRRVWIYHLYEHSTPWAESGSALYFLTALSLTKSHGYLSWFFVRGKSLLCRQKEKVNMPDQCGS